MDSNSVVKSGEGVIEEHKLLGDISFNSPSAATNFVTGNSTNGMLARKTKDGITNRKI